MALETALAAKPVETWTAFLTEDGLAHDLVSSVIQTADGSFWFGTLGGGISKYDGRSWRTYTVEEGLPGNAIGDLFEAEDGSLWAALGGPASGGSEHRLAKLVGDRWEAVDLPKTLANANVGHIIGVGGGGICFATRREGILHYDGSDWNTITSKDGLASNNVRCMLRAKDGSVWAAYGLSRGLGFGFSRGRATLGFGATSPPDRFDPALGRWTRSQQGGISRLDPKTGLWTADPALGQLREKSVVAMTQARDGSIWFGTLNSGALRYDGESWKTFTEADGLPSNRINDVVSASDGSVWFGTPAGAARYSPGNGQQGDAAWTVFVEEGGLPHNHVTSLFASLDGSVWAGTWGGAARFGTSGLVVHDNVETHGGDGRFVLTLDVEGDLWTAGGSSIYRFEGTAWEESLRLSERNRGRIVDLRLSPDGALWAATSRALLVHRNGEWRVPPKWYEMPRGPILSICPTKDGGLWMGTRSGAYKFDGETWSRLRLKVASPVFAIEEADDGSVWFGGTAWSRAGRGWRPKTFL